MKIIIYAIGLDHPDACTMRDIIEQSAITFDETTDRPVGPISAQPCVCAVYDNGIVYKSWVLPLNVNEITDAAGLSGEVTNQSDGTGRNITAGEFMKIGYSLGLAMAIDESLTKFPSLGLFLQQYISFPGIEYADAVPAQAPSTIRLAFARMITAGYITEQTIPQFLAKWVELYPKMVVA